MTDPSVYGDMGGDDPEIGRDDHRDMGGDDPEKRHKQRFLQSNSYQRPQFFTLVTSGTTPNTTAHSSAEYTDWAIASDDENHHQMKDDRTPQTRTPGSATCVLANTFDVSQPWRWVSGAPTLSVNKTCFEVETTTTFEPDQWTCSGMNPDMYDSSCPSYVTDPNAPWSVKTKTITNVPNKNWANTITYHQEEPTMTIQHHEALMIKQVKLASANFDIHFKSPQGSRGGLQLNVRASTVVYVAPASFTNPDGSTGDGSQDNPFTTQLRVVLRQVQTGDTRASLSWSL